MWTWSSFAQWVTGRDTPHSAGTIPGTSITITRTVRRVWFVTVATVTISTDRMIGVVDGKARIRRKGDGYARMHVLGNDPDAVRDLDIVLASA